MEEESTLCLPDRCIDARLTYLCPTTTQIQPEEKATATAAAASCASSDLAEASRRVQESCAEALAAVRSCKGEAECGRAAVGLTLCMAQLLCPEDVRSSVEC